MKHIKIISFLFMLGLCSAASAVTVVKYSDGAGYAFVDFSKPTSGSEGFSCARSEQIAVDGRSASTWTWCSARNADGISSYCYTSNPEFAEIVRGLSDYGRLLFRWTSSGECYAIQLVNSTSYLPESN